MSGLTYLQAVILGAVQGLTEFLPISSSAHLAFFQRWMGLAADSPSMLLFDAVTHVATLGSVLIVFWTPIWKFLDKLWIEIREWRRLRNENLRAPLQPPVVPLGKGDGKSRKENLCAPHSGAPHSGAPHSGAPRSRVRHFNALRLAMLAIAASVPTAAIGLGFKHQLEASFGHSRRIGAELAFSGLILAAMGFLRRGRKGMKQFRWWQAATVGVAQGIAILPGVSRSGSTIATASFFGLRKRWAAEFSFLIAFPAIFGACALKFKDVFDMGAGAWALPWLPILTGAFIALILGVWTLRILVRAVMRAKLHYFAIYCWIVGGLVMAGVL